MRTSAGPVAALIALAAVSGCGAGPRSGGAYAAGRQAGYDEATDLGHARHAHAGASFFTDLCATTVFADWAGDQPRAAALQIHADATRKPDFVAGCVAGMQHKPADPDDEP